MNDLFNIKSARVRAGFTQAEMAGQLGMSKNSYIKYENGRLIFRVDKAWEFSTIVGIPFDRITFFKRVHSSNCYANAAVNWRPERTTLKH